jgi:hypothetical protein
MPLAPVPEFFQPLMPLERALYAKLINLPNEIEREIRVSASLGDDATIRGKFFRWLLVEAIPSAAFVITNVEIEKAIFEDALDLKAVIIDRLLRFVECKFSKGVDLSDATIIGLEMVGGSISEIAADRLTVKGSMQLRARDEPKPIEGPRLQMLRLCGADIRGNLDMRGCSLRIQREEAGKTEEAKIVTAKDEEKTESGKNPNASPLLADGLTVHGNIMFSGGFNSVGELSLKGCNIGRNLDCSGANLSNPGGYSLAAVGAHITGSAYFCEKKAGLANSEKIPFTSNGTLWLGSAEIGGDLDCTGGIFYATAFLPGQTHETDSPDDDLYAIAADGLKVGSDIQFGSEENAKNAFTAYGIVSLINAHVKGDFSCPKAKFNFPGEEPLSADGLVVEGTTFLDDIVADGILRFAQANLKQGFYISGATFDPTKCCKSWTKSQTNIAANEIGGWSCGIYAPGAEVGGIFRWNNVKKHRGNDDRGPCANPFVLHIPGSKADIIEDDEKSWTELDRFEITGCEYETIDKLSDADADWRLRVLDRQYARLNITNRWPDVAVAFSRICHRFCCALPSKMLSLHDRVREAVKQFKPQPYIQLAKTFHAAGYEAAAHKVLVRLERNKTRYSDIGVFRQFWRYMLDIFLRYGYAPFRPVLIVLVWAAASAALFQSGYDSKQIIASKDNQTIPSRSDPAQDARIPFNAIVYAVDTLVPIVDLNQKKNWTVSTLSSFSGGPDQRLGWCEEVQRVWKTIPNQPLGVLLIFNTFFGWLMTTLFAAGISGLLRTGKDG